MDESTTREKVMKRIRNALIQKGSNPYPDIDLDSPVYHETDDSHDIVFAEAFTNAGGKFIYCESEQEFYSTLVLLIKTNRYGTLFCRDESLLSLLQQNNIAATNDESLLAETKVTLTGCEYLVARLGSIVVSSRQKGGRKLNISPDVHMVVATSSQLVGDLRHALAALREKYGKSLPSLVSFITGPSRTADIEKTLVLGAHGPRELYVFLLDDFR